MIARIKGIFESSGLQDGPFTYRVFVFVLLLTLVLTFSATMLNVMFGMQRELIAVTGISFVATVVALYMLITTRNTNFISIIFFICFLFFSFFSWLHNGGADGPTPTVIILYSVAVFIVIPEQFRAASLVVIIAMTSLLLYIHFYQPQLIDPYSRGEQRFTDLITAIAMLLLALYGLVAMVRKLVLQEHDIVVQKNKQLQEKNELINKFSEEQQNLNATREKFYSIVAHDLRGPFSVFLGISDIFENEYDKLTKEEIKELSQQLNKSLHRQYQLLNDLLEWSKMQYAEFGLHKQAVALHALTEAVTEELRLSAMQKKISLFNNVDAACTVFADPNYVKLLLRNLLSNSIKFTAEGGSVVVSGEIADGFAEVSVQDNGVGIPQQNLDRLFHEVTRITTRGTADETGTGFGLLLCREIVYNHGGSIWVDSQEGKGSTFHFTFPEFKGEK